MVVLAPFQTVSNRGSRLIVHLAIWVTTATHTRALLAAFIPSILVEQSNHYCITVPETTAAARPTPTATTTPIARVIGSHTLLTLSPRDGSYYYSNAKGNSTYSNNSQGSCVSMPPANNADSSGSSGGSSGSSR
ncbi:hypothetical protein jhhlp_008382 [Lomentospora prolificans]|uniref:Uncharacterized protein n=1 Tax=Lomentospora prolificans TaxID=41688 RepID=A0A2N3MXW6_9PEZI|nr:hypothetical protein jhhlp_008382 [Lomentospora prolificans]